MPADASAVTPASSRAAHWSARDARRALGPMGAVALAGLVALSVLTVLIVAERASFLSPPSHVAFPGWLAGPLSGLLPGLTRGLTPLKQDLTAIELALFACYVVALLCAGHVRGTWVVAAIALAHLAFLLAPPVSLTDVFNYLHYGRMGALHGLNPYVHLPVEARTEVTYPFSNWHHLRSPYGPLFTIGTYGLALLHLPLGYWLLRVATTAASLGIVALVWRSARISGRDPVPAAVMAGLNPLVLFYGIGGVHNDAFFILPLMAAVLLAQRRREGLGGGAVVMAAGMKLSALAALPVYVAGARDRRRALVGVVVGTVVVGGASLVAFGPHVPDLAVQERLFSPLSIPNLTGLALGAGGDTGGMRTAMSVALVVAVAAACLHAARQRTLAGPVAVVMLAEIVTTGWTVPWYVWWLLPFAALAGGRTLRVLAVVASLYLLLAWAPLTPRVIHSAGFHPLSTPAGRANSHLIHGLLR